MRALLIFALVCGPALAETCAELAARVESLKSEILRIERDATGADARLLECQGAAGAAFAERREMKQAASRPRWEAASWRLALSLQLLTGTLGDHPLTRAQGDPQRPVDDAVDALVTGGVWTLAGNAARLDEEARRATASMAPHVYQAALAALRELLGLMDAAGLTATDLPAPTPAEKLVRHYADPDALFEDPALAALKPRAAALDAALAGLELSLERERRPSESARELVERKRQELVAAQARLAGCTGR